MARPTAMDEYFVHQIPELLPGVAVRHHHWRESYFYEFHEPSSDGDAVFFTMAHYPAQERMDSLQMGRVAGRQMLYPGGENAALRARLAELAGQDPAMTVPGTRPETGSPDDPFRHAAQAAFRHAAQATVHSAVHHAVHAAVSAAVATSHHSGGSSPGGDSSPSHHHH